MTVHSLEIRRDLHTRAKARAKELGVTLDSYLNRLIEEYGTADYEPVHTRTPPPVRMKLSIGDDDWAPAVRRASAQRTTLTDAIHARIEEDA